MSKVSVKYKFETFKITKNTKSNDTKLSKSRNQKDRLGNQPNYVLKIGSE